MVYVPRVFIGSSSAGKSIAYAMESRLRSTMNCKLWFKETFRPTRTIIEDLERIARSEVDFAVLILTPDDMRDRGSGGRRVPRDNVLFELGLFMGALGRDRTFGMICGHCDIDLPTDLLGITWLEYRHPHETEERYAGDPVGLLAHLSNSVASAADELMVMAVNARREPVRAVGSAELVKVYPTRGLVTRPTWNEIISDVRDRLWLYGMAEFGYAYDDAVPGILENAAEADAEIRILLLNPAFSGTERIDRDEGKPAGTLKVRIEAALAQFSAIAGTCGGRMKIRVYDFPPVVSVVRGGNRMLVTPYVRFLSGENTPTFELELAEESGLFERYSRHFEQVWKSAVEWKT